MDVNVYPLQMRLHVQELRIDSFVIIARHPLTRKWVWWNTLTEKCAKDWAIKLVRYGFFDVYYLHPI